MKSALMLWVFLSASVSFASSHYEFFIRHGSMIVITDFPSNTFDLEQPVHVELRDSTTHQLVQPDSSWIEVNYYLPQTNFVVTMNPKNGYLDRCQPQIAGRVCGVMEFNQPGLWNITVTYKEFHGGDQEAQTYQINIPNVMPTPQLVF